MECIFDDCQKPNFAYGYCQGHAAQVRRGQPLAPLGRIKPQSPEGFSWCSKCKQHRTVDEFPFDKTRNQPDRVCRSCRAEYMRGYNAQNKDRIAVKVTLSKWKITEEQYLAMFDAQDHRCAICGAQRREARRLAIDHDHQTGLVRGLLCQDCNMGMGQFADDPDIMQKAVDYLRAGGVIHDEEFRIPKNSREFKRAQQRDTNRARQSD